VPSKLRIVALGDSLTSGHGIGPARAFPAILQRHLDAAGYDYQVVNAGLTGDTSAGALSRLPSLLDADTRILIVMLGANDGLRGVPVAQLKANLGAIISEALKPGLAVLLCGMEAPPLYGWDYSARFHRAYHELAARFQVPLVPFVLMNVIGRPDRLQADRIHPNEAGSRLIAERVWQYLQPLLRRTAPAARY
jgi:acyl-CoA thioesterase-1